MRVARRRHRRRYHSSLVGGTILAVAVLAAGCSLLPAGDQAGSGNGDADPAAEALPVRVAAAERRDLNADLRLSGTLEPDRSAPLVSLTGGRVAEVYVKEGEAVTAGTVVIRLDAGELAAHLNQAQASYDLAVAGLEQARMQLEHAQQMYSRTQAFMERGHATRYDVEDAEHQLRLARHQAEVVAPQQVEQARAALDVLRRQFQETRITAPISGTLARLDADVGTPVGAGQPVGVVVDAARMRLVVPVSELHIGRFQPGSTVAVAVQAARVELTGQVAFVPDLPADGQRSYPVEVMVDNPDGILKAGMTAEAVVPLERRQSVVAVPVDALVDQGEETFVYVVEGGRALRRPVETGILDGDQVEIVSGLDPGETVVVTGQDNLFDGARVRPVGDGSR